ISIYGPYNANAADTSLNQKALYSSLNYVGLTGKLAIELGARINDHSRYGRNYTYTFNPSYRLTKQVRVFGSIASGFKAPTLYQLSPNDKLQAEKSVNYEAGLQLNNNILNTRVVYFNRNINNGIDYNYITFNYFNYLKQVVNGLEIEAAVKPVKQVSISANYTWLASEEITQNRLTNKDTIAYNYLLRRPKHSLNTNISWQALPDLNLSITAKYVSSRYDVGGYQTADVLLKSYCIVGAHADYTVNKHAKLFADGQNLTNKKFFDVRGYNAIPTLVNGGIIINW
ncbi:MAG TPA: TonB-dependent receptor, partial [Segetibacter sp.]